MRFEDSCVHGFTEARAQMMKRRFVSCSAMSPVSMSLIDEGKIGTYDVVRARELRLLAVLLLEDDPDRAQQLPVRLVRVLLCGCRSVSVRARGTNGWNGHVRRELINA